MQAAQRTRPGFQTSQASGGLRQVRKRTRKLVVRRKKAKLVLGDPSPSARLGMIAGRGARSSLKKRPPEDYGKEDQTTVAAFLPWRGSLVLSP